MSTSSRAQRHRPQLPATLRATTRQYMPRDRFAASVRSDRTQSMLWSLPELRNLRREAHIEPPPALPRSTPSPPATGLDHLATTPMPIDTAIHPLLPRQATHARPIDLENLPPLPAARIPRTQAHTKRTRGAECVPNTVKEQITSERKGPKERMDRLCVVSRACVSWACDWGLWAVYVCDSCAPSEYRGVVYVAPSNAADAAVRSCQYSEFCYQRRRARRTHYIVACRTAPSPSSKRPEARVNEAPRHADTPPRVVDASVRQPRSTSATKVNASGHVRPCPLYPLTTSQTHLQCGQVKWQTTPAWTP